MNKLEKIINDSGIKFENDEAKAKFISQIDQDYVNGIVNKKENEYQSNRQSLEDKIAKLSEDFAGSNTSVKELQKQLNKINTENQLLKDKALAMSVAGELDDEQFEDLMLLTNAKLSKNSDLKKEDVMKDIAEKRGFGKKVKKENPAGQPMPKSKYFNGGYIPEEKQSEEKLETSAEMFKHFMSHSGNGGL